MRLCVLFLILLLAPFQVLGKAPAFEPIPPEVWAIRDNPSGDDPGAVFLKSSYLFTDLYLEHHFRIRIYSERGKEAANWPNFSLADLDIEGRTAYPDGSEVTFNAAKDLHRVNTARLGRRWYDEQVLVPPGLTGNCVVDIRWKQRYWLPSGTFGRFGKWEMVQRYPVRFLEVTTPRNAVFGWSFNPGNAARAAMTRTESRGMTTYTMRDLPAMPDRPFSLKGALDAPRFLAFTSNFHRRNYDKDDQKTFWADFCRNMKDFLGAGGSPGKTYSGFSEDIRKGLPAASRALAFELALRLHGRIRNLDEPTFQEKAADKRRGIGGIVHSEDLDASVKRGGTNSWGMLHLYLRLLQDAGLRPRLAFAIDRDHGVFRPDVGTVSQFDTTFVGVEEAGQPTLWVEPQLRFAAPGLIRTAFQGTPALEVDTATWTPRVITLPLAGPLASRREETYRLEILPDEDVVAMEAKFSGSEEQAERGRFFRLEGPEQDRWLRESLEEEFEAFRVESARVENATDPAKDLAWKVRGRFERDTRRTRTVDPFPLSRMPLAIPEELPLDRKELILLPQALTRVVQSSFRIPAGFTWVPADPFLRHNAFGDVSFRAERSGTAEGAEVRAILAVQVQLPVAGPDRWKDLLDFLGWVREAYETTLVLERADAR